MTHTISHDHLLCKLSAARKKAEKGRFYRLLCNPRQVLLNKITLLTSKPSVVTARTFWGQEMRILLPEYVSWNICHYGYFEYDVCVIMLTQLSRGMSVIDVGAHFGFFSLLARHLVGDEGMIISIEPTPDSFKLLRDNTDDYNNITAINCAAYDAETDIKFIDYGPCHSAFNSFVGNRSGYAINPVVKEITVATKIIDNIVREKNINRVDLIKIDAESSELHVLQGMENTLKLFQPAVILEVGDCDVQGVARSIQLIKLLTDIGYQPYEVKSGKIVPHQVKDDYKYGSLLFLSI